MVILGNFKEIYSTAITTANKSMGYDLSAIQSCCSFKYPAIVRGKAMTYNLYTISKSHFRYKLLIRLIGR